ncbi:MAG: gamma-glutamyltransferase [Thiohalomonadaceae bacterium]
MRRFIILAVLWCTTVGAAERPPAAAVASAHALATEAGFEILAAGGNAFDAAVAVSAALAVVEPYGSGLGGGGFWLLHRADGFETMVDGRETAPRAAHRDMYLDAAGEVVPGLSRDGPLAAGVPGEPAALAHIASRYGRLPLAHTLAPAIRLAREGFPVTEHYRRMAAFRSDTLAQHGGGKVFLLDGQVPPAGHVIRQPALAETLVALAERGHAGFYDGPVANRLVRDVRAGGGIITLEDLAAYRVIERQPLRGSYHGYTITTASPPSSGGVALLTMLNILEGYPIDALPRVARAHLLVEAMRRAYRDRAEFLGDPDFIEVPVARLTHPFYAAGLRASLRMDRATPSTALAPSQPVPAGPHTTHLSVLDQEGNYVAATLSINYPFGSGFLSTGTGVLLNDEMDDFSARPGTPNAYGLVGGEANAIAPGKRMLSSMTPTFIAGDGRVAVLGTPGGSRIITMVLLGVLDAVAGNGPASWVEVPRFHHQYLPDTLFMEPGAFTAEEQQALVAKGHRLETVTQPWGNMQAVEWNLAGNTVRAASDPRGEGSAMVRAVRD